MRERSRKKLIEKIDGVSNETFGETLYIRPFAEDDKIINEIVKKTGEKKYQIVQKLLHLALVGKQFDFDADKKQIAKLDWLINNEKHHSIKEDVKDARLERLEEHAQEMELRISEITENSKIAGLLLSEIYCIGVVCMSYLNQVFTKLIEYFSPLELERKNSTEVANRNVLGLLEHSLAELEKLSLHHDLESEILSTEKLYLFTKIEKIRNRFLTVSPKNSK